MVDNLGPHVVDREVLERGKSAPDGDTSGEEGGECCGFLNGFVGCYEPQKGCFETLVVPYADEIAGTPLPRGCEVGGMLEDSVSREGEALGTCTKEQRVAVGEGT